MRARVAVVLLLVASAGIAALAEGSSELRRAASNVQRGERAFRAGNLPRAELLYRKALAAVPGFPEASIGLGHVAMRERRFDEALDAYRAARAGYATLGEVLFKREQARYLAAQREIRALQDQIRLINSGLAKVSPATVATKTLELQNAIQELRTLPYPNDESGVAPPADLYFHIGNALFNLGRLEEAIGSWETCAEMDPDHALVHNNLAVGYLKQDRIDEARRCVARAEDLGMQVNPGLKRDIEAAAARLGHREG